MIDDLCGLCRHSADWHELDRRGRRRGCTLMGCGCGGFEAIA